MALFMDIHTLEGGVSAADVAEAHTKDLATQGRYGVTPSQTSSPTSAANASARLHV